MAIILNSMGTKDQTTGDIHILSCIFASVCKYFRRVHKLDMFLSAVDSDTQPSYSHMYSLQYFIKKLLFKLQDKNLLEQHSSEIEHKVGLSLEFSWSLPFNWTVYIYKKKLHLW